MYRVPYNVNSGRRDVFFNYKTDLTNPNQLQDPKSDIVLTFYQRPYLQHVILKLTKNLFVI